jgi:hypothetical protein
MYVRSEVTELQIYELMSRSSKISDLSDLSQKQDGVPNECPVILPPFVYNRPSVKSLGS